MSGREAWVPLYVVAAVMSGNVLAFRSGYEDARRTTSDATACWSTLKRMGRAAEAEALRSLVGEVKTRVGEGGCREVLWSRGVPGDRTARRRERSP